MHAAGVPVGSYALNGLLATMPFLAANYGTKAYLSPTMSRWASQGFPTLQEIMEQAAPTVGAGVQGLSAGVTQ